MYKSEKPGNFLKIARYFNENPRDSVKNLLKFCQKNDILRSYDSVYRALRVMEQERILLNGSILVKNHKDYKNIHYLIQIDDVDEFMGFVMERRDSIEAVYRSRQGKENILYVKSVCPAHLEDFSLVERIEWESYNIIFPWEWDGMEKPILDLSRDMILEESPPPERNLVANPDFEMTEDIKTLLYWYKVNLRLPDVPIMRETGFDHRKVKVLRERILNNSIAYFPTFLHGTQNYVPLYFSFFTTYYDFFIKLFARNSAVSFLIRGRNGRTFLLVNTIRPHWVLRAMEEFENKGIIEDMLFYSLQNRWDPLAADYRLGKIPEEYFWMFGVPEKRNEK